MTHQGQLSFCRFLSKLIRISTFNAARNFGLRIFLIINFQSIINSYNQAGEAFPLTHNLDEHCSIQVASQDSGHHEGLHNDCYCECHWYCVTCAVHCASKFLRAKKNLIIVCVYKVEWINGGADRWADHLQYGDWVFWSRLWRLGGSRSNFSAFPPLQTFLVAQDSSKKNLVKVKHSLNH